MRRASIVALAAVLALVTVGCSSGGGNENSGGSGGSSTTVATTLDDYSINPAVASVSAGAVTFKVQNIGATEHEMVVIKTDLDPADIPLEGHEANEEAPGMTSMGEVEDVQPGTSTELKLTLQPGNYIFLCNIKKHFERGMVTQFTVS